MDGFPDLRQQPASPLTHSASSVEDLVVVPEQQGPFPSSSSTSPLAAPLHVSAHDMVTVNPSYTAPNAFGVSFPGTANFAALPFPPAEHPLPPPGSLPARGVGPPAVACSPPLVPPPRPYVENKPVPPAPAPVPQQQPRPVPPPVEQPQYSLQAHAPPGPLPSAPPPLPNSMPSPPSQAQSQSPFVLFGPFPVPTQGPWQPQGMPSPYAAYGPPQGMHGGPTLTPWPPVPLRHIDSFLGGAYAPGPSYPPLPPQPQTPTTPTPTPQGQSFSVHRRESSSVASATTGPLEYPISSARSAAAHAAAQATQAARVEQARMGANYAHQQQQGGESGSPTSPFQSDLGSFSMSSMTGWSYPTPQQVHDAQQAHAAAQQAHRMQQQHQQHQHQHAQQQTPSPPHAHSTSPSSESDTQAAHAPSHDVCAVHGCACTVFCELSPCGCRLCRDHLGWVMRGAVTVEVDAGHEGDGGKDARSAKAATKRVFRCVACHVESSMAGPAHRASLAASSSSRRGSEHVVGLGLTGVEVPGEDDQAHAFSIKYFSSGPAPFAHRSPSPTSTIGGNGNGKNHDVDLSTALDPAGDASLVQHLPVPPPAIELQPASPTAQRSFATRGAATGAPPHLVPLDIEAAHRARPGAVEGAQPFLYQIEGPQSTSPGVLTPTERGSSGSSEHVAAAIEAVRPSSALPALEGNAAVPTLGDDDGRKRSLSRSATSPAAMYEPNPLEAALGAQAQAHAHGPAPARRQVPSPPESPASLLPVRTEGGPLPASMTTEGQSLVPSPPPPPQQHQQHAVQLQPDFTFPPQPPQPPPPHRAMRSFTHSGMLTVPYGTLPPMAYASFPPGSVSVQPHAQAHYQHVPPGAFHAQGLALQPVFASPLGGGGVIATGKKRGSLPPALLGPMAAGAGGLPRWIERMPGASGGGATGAGGGSGGGGAGQGGRGGISGSATFPPRQPPALDPMSDGARLERGGFPIVKVENIPFHTRVEDMENWVPAGYFPSENECIQPIHIILHRATGRTLPHCYLEIVNIHRATELIQRMDRSQLGDRTVRVKWERAGELMRDLFSQDAYSQMGTTGPGGQTKMAPSPAAAPLPHLPPEGFRIPDVLLTMADFGRLVAFSAKQIQFRERPFERSFYNVATLINKFPWSREDLWDKTLRDAMFNTTLQLLRRALTLALHDPLFVRISHLLVKSGNACLAFTLDQKKALSDALTQMITARPAPSKTRSSSSSPRGPLHVATTCSVPLSKLPVQAAGPVPAPVSEPIVEAPQTPQPAPRPLAADLPMTPESPLVPAGTHATAEPPQTLHARGAGRGRIRRMWQPRGSPREANETSEAGWAEQPEGAEELEQGVGGGGGEWVSLQKVEVEGGVFSEGGNGSGSGASAQGEREATAGSKFSSGRSSPKSSSRSSSGSTRLAAVTARPQAPLAEKPMTRSLSPTSFPPLPGLGTAKSPVSGLHTPPSSPETYRGGPALREP